MELIPDPSKPDEMQGSGHQTLQEIVARDRLDLAVPEANNALAKVEQNGAGLNSSQIQPLSTTESDLPLELHTQPLPEIDLRDHFTWINLAVVLSIPIVAGLAGLGMVVLYSPESINWLTKSEAPVFYSNSLWNLPKSLTQINEELSRAQLKLGTSYNLQAEQVLYTVLETETQNIRELRIYQLIRDRNQEKLLLISTTTISGIDEYLVRSPLYRYSLEAMPDRLQPNRRRLPLKNLSLLMNAPDAYKGTWFTTSAQIDGITYGQIYYFRSGKQGQLFELSPWTSPANEIPKWQQVLSNQKTQLVVNQTQSYEPLFLIWQPEFVKPETIQLRPINLNEAKGQPIAYQQALIYASAGLWSPALAKLDGLWQEWRSQGQNIAPYLQEQYDLIALHAKATNEQAQQPIANLGKKALVKIIDGQWEEAMAIASDPSYKADQIAEMLAQYHPHIWQRVTTLLTFTGVSKEVKLWGGLVVLQKQGLRRAENWLRSQKIDLKEADSLLQRMDLAPLKINPKQLIGTVRYLSKDNAGADWFLPPPPLENGQAWYEVSIQVIKDNEEWRNGPFRELSDRSSLLLWRVLGLSTNPNLGIVLYDAYGKTQSITIEAKSLWVSDNGDLKILASGQATLAPLLNAAIIPPLLTSGGAFVSPADRAIAWNTLPPRVIEQMIRNVYRELQRNGQVSVSIEELSLLMQEQWKLMAINLDGRGQTEYLLLINREQVDLGDRFYPIAIAFAADGSILFSSIYGGRQWIDMLPSNVAGQVLTFRNGFYEVWKF
ncbi:MAG: hypothetical protein NW214_00375 [Pseudanabaenaceae cyanobacterium bins.39]|nr:hypothetical protein [Pseudanabaenaceae cyanobacterium bins.39]